MISVLPVQNGFAEETAAATPRRLPSKSSARLARASDVALPPLPAQSLALASALATRAPRVLLLCGAAPNLSTGHLTLDIGRALVQLGHGPVLIIEADRTHRSLESTLGLDAGPGLLDDLHAQPFAEADLLRFVAPDLFSLSLGSAEAVHAAGRHPFATPRLPSFLAGMHKAFPWILIAAPFASSEADTPLLARHVEEVILAVQRGAHRRPDLLALQSRFAAAHLPPVSVVLT